jgi:hypothetical protein
MATNRERRKISRPSKYEDYIDTATAFSEHIDLEGMHCFPF